MIQEDLTLEEQIESGVNCGQVGFWIESFDPWEVLTSFAREAEDFKTWDIVTWDCIEGLQSDGKSFAPPQQQPQQQPAPTTGLAAKLSSTQTGKSALAAVEALRAVAIDREVKYLSVGGDLDKLDERYTRKLIFILQNGHREITNNGATQKDLLMSIQLTLARAKGKGCYLVILAPPGSDPPPELQEILWRFNHELPGQQDREEIIADVLAENSFEKLTEDKMDEAVKITGGLTRGQVEGVIARSLQRYGEVRESYIWSLKASTINKNGLLQLYRGDEKFDSYSVKRGKKEIFIPGLGGLQGVKDFCRQLILNAAKKKLAQPKGVLLLGVPGTGKSAFAKALGNETGRPTLELDVGALMGSLVGETESATRNMLRIADAMSPCILFVDELEKALGGEGGERDGGVNSRLRGSLLKWLNDHKSDVFFVATANDIKMLPPEFTRAERFDAIFFMDVPTSEQKKVIWDIYLKMFRLDPAEIRPDDQGWTGAEIKSCCSKAYLLDVPLVEAAKKVIPVMRTWHKKITDLRKWAERNCVDAESGVEYVFSTIEQAPGVLANPVMPELQGKRVTRKVTRRSPDPHE